MHSSVFIAVISGLGGMLGWGFADFFAKKTIDEIGDLRTLFWGQAMGILPLLSAFLIHPSLPLFHPADPMFLFLLGVFSALSYLPLYAGFGKGEVSLLSPIFASYSVVVVLLAAVFLHSQLGMARAFAAIIVFFGILLMSSDPRDIKQYIKVKSSRVKGVPEVLFATFSYSIWLLFLDKFLNGKSWLFFLLIIRVVSALTLLDYSYVTQKQLRVSGKKVWKYLIIIGVFDVGAFSSISFGYSHSSYVGIITVLSATFSLPTILLARTFLKEKVTYLQATAAALIICGIVIISLV